MKKGGLLERIIEDDKGVCKTCGHVVDIGSNIGYGCEAHDKLILAAIPPASGNQKCKEWIKHGEETV